MRIVTNIILGCFGLTSLLHLYAAFYHKEHMRRMTKVCIMPLLVAYYVLLVGASLFTVPLGAIFGWAGDVFLIKIDRKHYFRMGLFFLLLGHLFYVFSLLYYAETIFMQPLIISIIIALPLCAGIFFFSRPARGMRFYVVIYGMVIEAMSISALQLMLNHTGLWGVVIFAGSLLFMVSDSLLACFTFNTPPKYGDIYVMLPYILAQASLVVGLAQL